MLQTRGWKYRLVLRQMHLFKYLAFAPTRGEFLESYYTLMRYLDDIVDGDVPLPSGYENIIEYLNEKISFSKDPGNPADEVDYLMLYCFQLAEKFGEDFHEETKDILDSLLFDANRRGKGIVFSREELHHHFHLLDIRGTIRATLKIFKDDPGKYLLLESLGMASRHQYDIEDLATDIKAGYINISKEDCTRFGIGKAELSDTSSAAMITWLHHYAIEGLTLLEEHHRIMPIGKFSLLEKATFRLVYENPARKVFLRVLSNHPNEIADGNHG
jgi:hypothetical protein